MQIGQPLPRSFDNRMAVHRGQRNRGDRTNVAERYGPRLALALQFRENSRANDHVRQIHPTPRPVFGNLLVSDRSAYRLIEPPSSAIPRCSPMPADSEPAGARIDEALRIVQWRAYVREGPIDPSLREASGCRSREMAGTSAGRVTSNLRELRELRERDADNDESPSE